MIFIDFQNYPFTTEIPIYVGEHDCELGDDINSYKMTDNGNYLTEIIWSVFAMPQRSFMYNNGHFHIYPQFSGHLSP